MDVAIVTGHRHIWRWGESGRLGRFEADGEGGREAMIPQADDAFSIGQPVLRADVPLTPIPYGS